MLRLGTGQEDSQAEGEAGAALGALGSDADMLDSSGMLQQASSGASGSLPVSGAQQGAPVAGAQEQGPPGAARGGQAASAGGVEGPATAEGQPEVPAEQAQLEQEGMSPQEAQRLLPPSPFGHPSPLPASACREDGPPGRSAAEQDHAAASGGASEQAGLQNTAAPPAAASTDRRSSLDGELHRRTQSAGSLDAFHPPPTSGSAGGSASALGSPRSTGAGLQRASSADGLLPHLPAATAAEAAGPAPQRRGPLAVPFASLGDLVDAAISSSPPPSGLPPRLPPRPPPPKPTAQHPIVVNIFRVSSCRAWGGGLRGWRNKECAGATREVWRQAAGAYVTSLVVACGERPQSPVARATGQQGSRLGCMKVVRGVRAEPHAGCSCAAPLAFVAWRAAGHCVW